MYTVGVICDKLEAAFPGLVRYFKEWKKVAQNVPKVKKVFKDAIPPCLSACRTSLCFLVASLRKKADSQGEEKVRHAGWLDQQLSGVVLAEEQLAEIKHAIVVRKGRYHKAKYEELAKKSAVAESPDSPGAEGSIAASSSGYNYPSVPRRIPSRNPPVPTAPSVPPLALPQGNIPAIRGAAKRVRSGSRGGWSLDKGIRTLSSRSYSAREV